MSKKYSSKSDKNKSASLEKERFNLLIELQEVLELPLNLLSIVWLGLVIYDFVYGLAGGLETTFYVIWGIFVFDFVIEILLAPDKKEYIKNHLVTVIALFIPTIRALRIIRSIRVLRAARAVRSVSLIQILTSLNRGMKTLREVFEGRGMGYIAALTMTVAFVGAAAIYYFEGSYTLRDSGYSVNVDNPINSYWDALWFVAMLMVTTGSDYWPKSGEGRILTFVLSLYAFAIFGYITATIASFIIGKDYKKNN